MTDTEMSDAIIALGVELDKRRWNRSPDYFRRVLEAGEEALFNVLNIGKHHEYLEFDTEKWFKERERNNDQG